jgi:hypothetical protein
MIVFPIALFPVPFLLCVTLSTTWIVLLASFILVPTFRVWLIIPLVATVAPAYLLAINNLFPYFMWFGHPLFWWVTTPAAIVALVALFVVRIPYALLHTSNNWSSYHIQLHRTESYLRRPRPSITSPERPLLPRPAHSTQPCPTHIHDDVVDLDSPSKHFLRLRIAVGYSFLSGMSYAVCLIIAIQVLLFIINEYARHKWQIDGLHFELLPIVILSPPLLALLNIWHIHKILALIRPGWTCSCQRLHVSRTVSVI